MICLNLEGLALKMHKYKIVYEPTFYEISGTSVYDCLSSITSHKKYRLTVQFLVQKHQNETIFVLMLIQ